MNWGETNKKLVEEAEREKLLGISPTVFLFNLGPAVRAAALFLHLFTKHERKTHQKKACRRPTFCPPCQGLTKTSKVWVQTNIFSHKEVTWSRDQKYLQFSERLDGHFDLWGWNFSLWLVITIVHFVFREEIQVNQNTKTSRDFLAWNSWKLTSWACYRGCCAKGKKSWRCCLVGKYVRYTKMTPVIYFAPQTLNNTEFYDANLIFQKENYHKDIP